MKQVRFVVRGYRVPRPGYVYLGSSWAGVSTSGIFAGIGGKLNDGTPLPVCRAMINQIQTSGKYYNSRCLMERQRAFK